MLLTKLFKKFLIEKGNRINMRNKQSQKTNTQTKAPYAIFVVDGQSKALKLVKNVKDLIREEITDLIKQEFEVFEKR